MERCTTGGWGGAQTRLLNLPNSLGPVPSTTRTYCKNQKEREGGRGETEKREKRGRRERSQAKRLGSARAPGHEAVAYLGVVPAQQAVVPGPHACTLTVAVAATLCGAVAADKAKVTSAVIRLHTGAVYTALGTHRAAHASHTVGASGDQGGAHHFLPRPSNPSLPVCQPSLSCPGPPPPPRLPADCPPRLLWPSPSHLSMV